ncbi:hypothetical protein O3P69_000228 [Scylla paramamosain]|uniref:Uncharacterized protein n=1 Tax=Scylla paramamosain TaxID=85552 RepID=A0AAW0UXQ8_SCYPA
MGPGAGKDGVEIRAVTARRRKLWFIPRVGKPKAWAFFDHQHKAFARAFNSYQGSRWKLWQLFCEIVKIQNGRH